MLSTDMMVLSALSTCEYRTHCPSGETAKLGPVLQIRLSSGKVMTVDNAAYKIEAFYLRRMRLAVEQTEPVTVHVPEKRFSVIDYQLFSPTPKLAYARCRGGPPWHSRQICHPATLSILPPVLGDLDWSAGWEWSLPELKLPGAVGFEVDPKAIA